MIMPRIKNNFFSIIIAFLPILVTGLFFSHAINSDTGMKTKLENILGASTTNLVNFAENDNQKIGIISGIMDSIFRLDDNNEAHFNKIKIRGRNSEPDLFSLEKDQSFIWLDKDMKRLFLSQFGIDKIEIITAKYFNKNLSFGQNLEVSKDLTVNGDSNFRGAMILSGNFTGTTATLANAYISENALINGDIISSNLYLKENLSAALGQFTTLASGYFSTPLEDGTFNFMGGTISAETIYLGSNKFIDKGDWMEVRTFDGFDFVNQSNNLIYASFNPQYSYINTELRTQNLSAALGQFTTLASGYFSTPLEDGTFNFMGGTISAETIYLGSNKFIDKGDWMEVRTFDGFDFVNQSNNLIYASFNPQYSYINTELRTQNFSAALGSFTQLGINGAFSAGNSTIGQTTLLGDLKLNSNGASKIEIFGKNGDFGVIQRTSDEFRMNAGLDQVRLVFSTSDTSHQFKQAGVIGFEIFKGDENVSTLNLKISKATAQLILTGSNSNVIINGKTVTTNASDSILKSGIEEFGDTLEYIKELRAVTFNWINPENTSETIPGRNLGMIAQEVETVIPNLGVVATNPDGTKYIKYDLLSTLLVEGVKEQQIQIQNLSEAIGSINLDTLQSNYDDFKSALNSLSLSTQAGSLIVNSGLTVTGSSLLNEVSITGNITAGQIKIDSLENDISIDTAPCIDLEGDLNETDCTSNQLNIMKNKSGNVTMFDGKVRFKPNGEVLGEKVQAKTFKNNNTSTPSNSSSCSTGEFKFAEDGGKSFIYYCNSNSNWTRAELSSF